MTCLLARGPQGKSGGELLFWSTAAGLMNNVVLAMDLAKTLGARSFASTRRMTVFAAQNFRAIALTHHGDSNSVGSSDGYVIRSPSTFANFVSLCCVAFFAS